MPWRSPGCAWASFVWSAWGCSPRAGRLRPRRRSLRVTRFTIPEIVRQAAFTPKFMWFSGEHISPTGRTRDRAGGLIRVGADGAARVFSPAEIGQQPGFDDDLNGLAGAPDGSVWMGLETFDQTGVGSAALVHVSPQGQARTVFSDTLGATVSTIGVTPSGVVWATDVEAPFDDNTGTTTEKSALIRVDASDRITPFPLPFRPVPEGEHHGNGAAIASDGAPWFFGNGLVRFQNGVARTMEDQLDFTSPGSLAPGDHGSMWHGNELISPNGRIRHLCGIPRATNLARDSAGRLWFDYETYPSKRWRIGYVDAKLRVRIYSAPPAEQKYGAEVITGPGGRVWLIGSSAPRDTPLYRVDHIPSTKILCKGLLPGRF